MAAQKSKENTATTNGSVLDNNKVLVYVMAKKFHPGHCLQVTKENLDELVELTAQDEYSEYGWQMREAYAQNFLVMSSFMHMQINNSTNRYVVILAGCQVLVYSYNRNNLLKSILNDTTSTPCEKSLGGTWIEYTFGIGDILLRHFHTKDIDIVDKSLDITLDNKSLKEVVQEAIQAVFDTSSKESAVMYGLVEESEDGDMVVG